MSDTDPSQPTLIESYNDADPFAGLSDKDKAKLTELAARLTSVPYCPWTPTHKQRLFLLDFDPEALYGGAVGGAKALTLNTLIATPNGFQPMGNIHIGDQVLGRDGIPAVVLAESEVTIQPGWSLQFDDGSRVEVSEDHLWLTYTATELAALTRRDPEWRARRRATRPSRGTGKRPDLAARNSNSPTLTKAAPTGSVRSTAEIVRTLLTPSGRVNHAVPVSDPLVLPSRDLPLDPYVLGAWLGDGSSASGAICSMDQPIINEIEAAGWKVRRSDPRGKASLYFFEGLTTKLREVGVLKNKHIPHEFLWASQEQRLSLLQGLMDTDGTTNGTSASFVNTNRGLVDGVAFLFRSFGHKVSVQESRATLYGKDCGPVWRVKVAPHVNPFRLSRKADKQRLSIRRTTKFRYIVDAKRIPAQPMKCLRVDNDDHLFLATEHLIPTHNSVAILMAALQFIEVPNYAALLLRKSFTDLTQPDALMSLADEWFKPYPEVRFDNQTHSYLFPSGAKLVFGFIERERDRFKYQGAQYQFVGWDELTQHKMRDYTYLFSRQRKRATGALSKVPVRTRATTNPGDIGHEWVYRRFIKPWEDWRAGKGPKPKRNFHPSMLSDNPHIDREDYLKRLDELDPVTRAQYVRGDWSIRPEGRMFKREWFKPCSEDDIPSGGVTVRYWDLAATNEDPEKDPDWTAGVLVTRAPNGHYFIRDVQRFRSDPDDVVARIRATAERDREEYGHVLTYMEQEPGASGKTVIAFYRKVLDGFTFYGNLPSGKKTVRAGPVASRADGGDVHMVRGSWNDDFLDELEIFPDSAHDDQADGLSGCFQVLARHSVINVSPVSMEQASPWNVDGGGWVPEVGVAREQESRAGSLDEELEREIRAEAAKVRSAWQM